jgi:hypothetical protein
MYTAGGRTPMHDGSTGGGRTPSWTAQTPSWDVGSRTPAWEPRPYTPGSAAEADWDSQSDRDTPRSYLPQTPGVPQDSPAPTTPNVVRENIQKKKNFFFCVCVFVNLSLWLHSNQNII